MKTIIYSFLKNPVLLEVFFLIKYRSLFFLNNLTIFFFFFFTLGLMYLEASIFNFFSLRLPNSGVLIFNFIFSLRLPDSGVYFFNSFVFQISTLPNKLIFKRNWTSHFLASIAAPFGQTMPILSNFT